MSKYKSLEELLEELGARESSGNYSAVNDYNYLGKYQMGESALSDAGYYKGSSPGNKLEWAGKFNGKDGVYSKEDFLKNHQAQENAMRDYMKRQWQILRSNGSTKYVGSNINGIEITPSGLLGGAHLVGGGGVGNYTSTKGRTVPKDGNGTSIEEYLKKFAGYDVSEITDPNYYAPKFGVSKEDAISRVLNQGKNVISGVANQVMPSASIPDKVMNKARVQPPLTEEEWRKRLRRQRMGLESY